MTEKANLKRQQKGITLIALVVTIIVLLILAGISIMMLTGENGILNRASQAKIAQGIAQVEEIARLRLQAAYAENLGMVDDATARTAVIAELTSQGYEVKDISTSNQTVKGLLIQDDTGNNIDEVAVVQGKTVEIQVALDTEGDTSTKTYVKIYGKYYEIDITGQNVNVSREAYKEVPDEDNGYQIKLTPPTNGVEMTVGGTKITTETAIVAGAKIIVNGGNSTGTFVFTVKEAKSNVTRNVNVVVSANPLYATDLSIAVKDGGSTTVEARKTVSLVATKTPSSSTDTVKWSIKSGSATVDNQGNVKINSDATDGSTVIVAANLERADGSTSSVAERTITLTVKVPAEDDDYTVSSSEIGTGAGGTADEIASKTNKEIATYFGAKVTNYETDQGLDDGDAEWEIFYIGKDPETNENNIYLILSDYMKVKNTPSPSDSSASVNRYESEISKFASLNSIVKDSKINGTKIAYASGSGSGSGSGSNSGSGSSEPTYSSGVGQVTGNQQNASFDNVYSNSKYGGNGLNYIKQKSQAKGWFSYNNTSGGSNSNKGATAYMLDTGIWTNKYKDSDYTKYVTGGPTLELYVASWNKKYPKNKLYCNNSNSYGYFVGTSSNPRSTYTEMSSTTGYSDKLYNPHTSLYNSTLGYWLASPSAYYSSIVMYVYCSGDVGCFGGYDYGHFGFRPLVCLSSNIKLVSNGNGTYKLQK